jgi:glutamyl-tRNA reductase
MSSFDYHDLIIDSIEVHTLDDLREAAERARGQRCASSGEASAILALETGRFTKWLAGGGAGQWNPASRPPSRPRQRRREHLSTRSNREEAR